MRIALRFLVGPILALVVTSMGWAQDGVAGDWLGTLDAGPQKLRVVFHISESGDGTLETTMDSPDQGATGIATGSTTMAADQLKIEIPAIGGGFEGTLNADRTKIDGTWRQGAASLPLVLERVEGEIEASEATSDA